MIDLACQKIGAISVPIYTSLTSEEIRYILKDCGAKFLAVSTKSLFEKIPPIQKSCEALQGIIAMDAAVSLRQNESAIPIYRLTEFEREGSETALRADSIAPDQVASIIYTSGTTGFPKGVMLTHSNFVQNAIFCKQAFPMSQNDVHLSFLPLSHVFERTVGYYLMLLIGATVAYAETMDTVSQNMLEVHPTFLLGVPRFYEKVQNRVKESL